MSDISSDRIEPAARVIEPQGPAPPGPEARGRPDSGSRRRPAPPPEQPEIEDDPELPAHQVDRLV
jgi:hypothetical protein